MKKISNEVHLKLESILNEISDILYNKMNINIHFEDLDRSINIVKQKNTKHYISINKKIANLTRVLYDTGLLYKVREDEYEELINKLIEIDSLLIFIKNNTVV